MKFGDTLKLGKQYRLESEQLLAQYEHNDSITRVAFWTNQTFGSIIGFPFLPLQLISTFILGLLVRLTFGLLLFPFSAIWMIFLGPILGTSWIWLHVPFTRYLLFIPGILWAGIANIYTGLIPEMGEFESRKRKIDLCYSWPLSWYIIKPNNESILMQEKIKAKIDEIEDSVIKKLNEKP